MNIPMKKRSFSPLVFQLSRQFFIFLLGFVISLLALFVVRGHAADENSNTAFFPLKINSAEQQDVITEAADFQLKTALSAFGIQLIPRSEAETTLNYESWPPDYKMILSASPLDSTDYAVIGSTIQTGSKVSLDFTVYDLLDKNRVKFFYQEGEQENLNNLLGAAVKEIISYTNRRAILASVKITGNKKIDHGAIVQKVPLADGDPYDPDKLRQAIKDLYKMGYFEDIQISVLDSLQGREVTIHVIEKDVIGQIIIQGEEELDKEKIIEVIEIVPNNIINNKDIQDSVASIKELYKQEGYYATKVTSALIHPKAGKVDVKFVINEGSKVFIKDITMTGNEAFSDKKLFKIVQTSEKGWLSWLTDSGVLNHDIIQQDAARISAYYHNNGYIEAKIGKPEISQKGDWFYVNFNISEGERYRVGTVDLSGDLIEEKSSLLSNTKIIKEKYFSREILRDDILKITDTYAEKGYAFAEATPTTDKDAVNKRINIVIDISKQELVHINRIVIRGNSRTRDKVIRREIKVKETGIFNATALKNSQKRLQRLDFFEDIQITPEPTAESNMMDIVVNVKEKPTGNFSIGAGYSSVDSFMFMSEISQNNFLGKGQRLSLQANLSKASTQYNLSFTEPHLADSKLMAGIDLFNWTREYDDYDKESTGFGFRFGYPLGWKWYLSSSYSFDDTTLTELGENPSQAILDSLEINTTSAVKFGFSRDSRNKFPDATSGSNHSLSVKYAGGVLAGDAAFTKFDAASNYYFPLPFETSLHYKLAGGWAISNETNKLPVYEKYYLGGINTIRGFKSGSISPVDPVTNEKIGGGKMWYSNLEWIFPLVEEAGLKGVLFLDAGNVYDTNENWDFGEIKKSAGFGFRWLSPMGPLRLEWGHNLDPKEDEVKSNWDFSIGGSF